MTASSDPFEPLRRRGIRVDVQQERGYLPYYGRHHPKHAETIGAVLWYSDLRGFTSYAETLPPATVISVLNRYLTLMSDVILDNGGTLVAYMGDGIMAVFGAPINRPDDPVRAVRAARGMRRSLREFNARQRAKGGVEVDIVIPDDTDLPHVRWAMFGQLWQVLDHGCRVWTRPGAFDHSA